MPRSSRMERGHSRDRVANLQETCAISLNATALKEALAFKARNPQWEACSLRVYIAGKGCDGFSYGVSFDQPEPQDQCFPQMSPSGERVDVIVDPESLKFLRGSVIDWVDDERGKGFLVENPKHKKFRGKFYKRAGWEQRLLEQESEPQA